MEAPITSMLPFMEEDIIRRCQDAEVIGRIEGGSLVRKISTNLAVKVGRAVTADEAANQEFAYAHVDKTIFGVSKVHGFFQDAAGIGYLVMDFVEGESLERYTSGDDNGDLIEKLAAAVDHLQSIGVPLNRPGPVEGGRLTGIPWCGETLEVELKDRLDLNKCLDKRLDIKPCKHSIDVKPLDLTMCHLDLAPRNVLVRPDRSIYILDWAPSGFYPRSFQLASLRYM